MTKRSIQSIVAGRFYSELEDLARKSINEGDWSNFVRSVEQTNPEGKARNALVQILGLEAIGGTDSNIFNEFRQLNGSTLEDVQVDAVEKSMVLLRSQIDRGNTFFIKGEELATSPFAILFDEVMNARLSELNELSSRPSRNDLLRTYYGFTLLVMGKLNNQPDGNQRYRHYWRRRYKSRPELAKETTNAIKQLLNEYTSTENVDTRYETLGTSAFLEDKCGIYESRLLANIARLALYQTPWDRGRAALSLGKVGDARSLHFLYKKMETEQDVKARASILQSIGLIGFPSSIEFIEPYTRDQQVHKRISLAAVEALGYFQSVEVEQLLKNMLGHRDNRVKLEALATLKRLNTPKFYEVLRPLARSRSKMVLREVVRMLFDEGNKGREILAENAPRLISYLYNDDPSHRVIERLLTLDEITHSDYVHQLYVRKLETLAKRARKTSNMTRSSWYWRSHAARDRQRVMDTINLIKRYFANPLPQILQESVSNAIRILDLNQPRDASKVV